MWLIQNGESRRRKRNDVNRASLHPVRRYAPFSLIEIELAPLSRT
jgi:hypothetical protein